MSQVWFLITDESDDRNVDRRAYTRLTLEDRKNIFELAEKLDSLRFLIEAETERNKK